MADREQPYDPYIPAGGNAPASGASGQGDHRTAALQAEVNSTIDTMRQNLAKVSERGSNLDSLQDKTNNLQNSAMDFRRGANRVRKNMWWREQRMRCIVIGGIILLLAVIIIPSVLATR